MAQVQLKGPTQAADCTPGLNFTVDYEFYSPSRYGPSRPLYKPEFWDKVQRLDMWTNKEDPVMACQPLGIPRQGASRRIFQTASDVTFIYGIYGDAGGGTAEFRIIPTDDRKAPPKEGHRGYVHGVYRGAWRLERCGSTGLPTPDFCRERAYCEVYEREDISTQIRH